MSRNVFFYRLQGPCNLTDGLSQTMTPKDHLQVKQQMKFMGLYKVINHATILVKRENDICECM